MSHWRMLNCSITHCFDFFLSTEAAVIILPIVRFGAHMLLQGF